MIESKSNERLSREEYEHTEINKLDDKQIRFISGNNQPQRIPRSPNQEDREDDDDDDDDERKPDK